MKKQSSRVIRPSAEPTTHERLLWSAQDNANWVYAKLTGKPVRLADLAGSYEPGDTFLEMFPFALLRGEYDTELGLAHRLLGLSRVMHGTSPACIGLIVELPTFYTLSAYQQRWRCKFRPQKLSMRVFVV